MIPYRIGPTGPMEPTRPAATPSQWQDAASFSSSSRLTRFNGVQATTTGASAATNFLQGATASLSSRRGRQLQSWEQLRQALTAEPCTLNLLQLAMCVKNTPGNIPGDILLLLSAKFAQIKERTPDKFLNSATFSQWAYGIPKFPTWPRNVQAAGERLLAETAALLREGPQLNAW